jgi:DNA-binding transcriptional LysR family regulator
VNNDLVFFVLLAKHGSLAATARELGLTPPPSPSG